LLGIASGAYSSIFIASPVLTHWKEREPAYRHRRERIVKEQGALPAYATTAGGAPEDVEPAQKAKRSRRGSIIAPEEPGAQISREEFQDLVRDLDVEGKPTGVAQQERERDPAADLAPEDLVLKDEPKRREKTRRAGGRRNKRHGRSR
jgi:SecD/SecF fusion protein